MTGGRIVNHAAYYLPMESTRLMIVGYQAVGTLGRKILNGDKTVYINGVSINVKATITETQALSSHADQSQLMTWLKHIKGVKKLILTHGEEESREILSKKITEELGINDIFLPQMNTPANSVWKL